MGCNQTKMGTITMEKNTMHWIDIDGDDVEVSMTWEITDCECTSDYGNSEVTERWEEAEALEARLIVCGMVIETYFLSEEPDSIFSQGVIDALYNRDLSY
jgi:hypothetical protein